MPDAAEALTVLTASDVRRWFEQGLRSMLALRRQVDVLNVFPVPDGDTGTNIVLTLAGAARAASRLPADAGLAALTAAAARGALVGARGNSGVILSQAMHGLARSVAGQEVLDGQGLATALDAAAQDARRAVDQPVDGTILTVAAAAAHAAGAVAQPDLARVVRAATDAAATALVDTRSQLQVLAERDVVDAGAAGYVVLLEAPGGVVGGAATPGGVRARDRPAGLWAVPRPAAGGPSCALGKSVVGQAGAAAFEVMYVLRATAADAFTLRRRLAEVGESIAVVGGAQAEDGSGLWQVHVHTDDPAAVLADPAAMEQVGVRPLLVPARGLVACTSIPALAAPLAGAGAVVVLFPDRPGLERAVVDAGAARVLVLTPDDSTAALAREYLGGDELLPGGPRADVVAAGSEIAVLAVVGELAATPPAPDPTRTPSASVEDAARLVAQVRTTESSVADLPAVLAGFLRAEDEVLTGVVGAVPGGPEPVAQALRAAARSAAPVAEVIVLHGGQAAPDVLLGAQ